MIDKRDFKLTEWRWEYFTPDEMKCKGTGKLKVNTEFMDCLNYLRIAYGKPMIVTSGYRHPDYNEQVSSSGRDGPHTTGCAVDIKVAGADAWELLRLALHCGFTGIGIKQKGPWDSRFIHLDTLEGDKRPRVWSY